MYLELFEGRKKGKTTHWNKQGEKRNPRTVSRNKYVIVTRLCFSFFELLRSTNIILLWDLFVMLLTVPSYVPLWGKHDEKILCSMDL